MRIQKSSTIIIISLVLSVVGMVALIIGGRLTSDIKKKKETYIETKGIVIYLITSDGTIMDDDVIDYVINGTRQASYAPVVEYYVNGKRYETTHKVYSYPPEYKIGEEVILQYNPDDPTDVIFKSNSGIWIVFLVGSVFSIGGVSMLCYMLVKRRINFN